MLIDIHELANLLSLATLMLVIGLAVSQDLLQHRISNQLTFTGLAAGLAIQSTALGLDGFLLALAGAGVGLLCLLPLYLCKGMGAGDVKLMAAAGAFLGPANAFVAVLISLSIGAVLAIAILLWRLAGTGTSPAGANGAAMTGFRSALARAGGDRFPYAVAIATGVLVTLWLRGMLALPAGSVT